MRKTIPPDKPDQKPKTIAEAKQLVKKIFSEQGKTGWDDEEQKVFFAMIGVEGMDKAGDVRAIINDLESAGMIIF